MHVALTPLANFDHSAVAHLKLEPGQEEFVVPLDVTFSDLRNSLHPEWEHPFSIVVGNETVGFFVLREKAALPHWAPPGVITLHGLRVGQAYQRKGYGNAAVILASKWISINRLYIDTLMLSVNARNTIAKHAYLRWGFSDTGATWLGPTGPQNILEHKVGFLCGGVPGSTV